MTVYLVAFCSIIFFLIIYLVANNETKLTKKRNLRVLIIFIGIILIAIGGVRNNIGRDFSMYKSHYDIISNYSIIEIIKGEIPLKTEVGYAILNLFCYKMNFGFIGVTFITQAITIILILKSCKYYSKTIPDEILSILIFFVVYYFSTFNLIRQSITMAIFIYISRYIVEKKLLKYLCGILIGSFFHQSILFMIPIYFIDKIKFNIKSFILSIITFFIFSNTILKFVIFFVSIFNTKYTYYIENQLQKLVNNTNNLSVFDIINLIIIGIVIYFRKNTFSSEKDIVAINIYMFFLLFNLAFPGSELIGRSIAHFSILGIVSIPLILNTGNKRMRNYLFIALVLYYSLYFFYNLYFYSTHPLELIIPYDTIFNSSY